MYDRVITIKLDYSKVPSKSNAANKKTIFLFLFFIFIFELHYF